MTAPESLGMSRRAGSRAAERLAARRAMCAAVCLLAALGPERAMGQSTDAATSVVRVVCVTSTRAAAGGGVVVESSATGERVATSARLVACAGEGGRVAVGGRSGDLVAAAVEWSSPALDLAIVRTARPSGARAARIAAADLPDGADDVRVVGFPGAGTVDATDRLGAALFVPTAVPGALIGTRRTGGTLTRDTDAALTPGMRGGVLVNTCGEVLGIVGEDGGAAGARLRVLARAPLLDALRDRRIAADVSTTACASGAAPALGAPAPPRAAPNSDAAAVFDALPPWAWAVALGALLVALLPLLVRRRRSAPREASPEAPASSSPPAPAMDAVPVVPAASVPSPAAPPVGYTLRGLPGVLAGVHLPLGERLRIGRDAARCDVVVPASAAAVSKRHAVVFADATGLWIQDGGSANGTFIAGRRIEPNRPVRLSVGARVHLATPDVAFTVT